MNLPNPSKINLDNPVHRIVDRLASTTYVVVLRVNGQYSLLMEPGFGRPWRGQDVFGKKFGDMLAKDQEQKGRSASCMIWADAYKLLVKQMGGEKEVERFLVENVVRKQNEMSNPVPPRIPSS